MRRHAAAIVANGGAPNGPPRCCPGDRDGHLMPLSPTVRSRYDNTVPHCSATVPALLQLPPLLHFYPFSLTLTPVGDPFAYKRRPVCNAARVRTFRGLAHFGIQIAIRSVQQLFELAISPVQFNQPGAAFCPPIARGTW